jgi:hypothetical protein
LPHDSEAPETSLDRLCNRYSQDSTVPTKFAGGVAGIAATLVVHPIDVIKTRMQVGCVLLAKSRRKISGELGALKEFSSVPDAVKKIYAKDGVRAFYKGFMRAPPC